jgi:hypothetical protein
MELAFLWVIIGKKSPETGASLEISVVLEKRPESTRADRGLLKGNTGTSR